MRHRRVERPSWAPCCAWLMASPPVILSRLPRPLSAYRAAPSSASEGALDGPHPLEGQKKTPSGPDWDRRTSLSCVRLRTGKSDLPGDAFVSGKFGAYTITFVRLSSTVVQLTRAVSSSPCDQVRTLAGDEPKERCAYEESLRSVLHLVCACVVGERTPRSLQSCGKSHASRTLLTGSRLPRTAFNTGNDGAVQRTAEVLSGDPPKPCVGRNDCSDVARDADSVFAGRGSDCSVLARRD